MSTLPRKRTPALAEAFFAFLHSSSWKPAKCPFELACSAAPRRASRSVCSTIFRPRWPCQYILRRPNRRSKGTDCRWRRSSSIYTYLRSTTSQSELVTTLECSCAQSWGRTGVRREELQHYLKATRSNTDTAESLGTRSLWTWKICRLHWGPGLK